MCLLRGGVGRPTASPANSGVRYLARAWSRPAMRRRHSERPPNARRLAASAAAAVVVFVGALLRTGGARRGWAPNCRARSGWRARCCGGRCLAGRRGIMALPRGVTPTRQRRRCAVRVCRVVALTDLDTVIACPASGYAVHDPNAERPLRRASSSLRSSTPRLSAAREARPTSLSISETGGECCANSTRMKWNNAGPLREKIALTS